MRFFEVFLLQIFFLMAKKFENTFQNFYTRTKIKILKEGKHGVKRIFRCLVLSLLWPRKWYMLQVGVYLCLAKEQN
jgi:hypothetical protein